jgi:zinc/manganese transport system substrate-binding protein
VIVNGLGFEGWIDRLIKSSGYRGKRVVASQGVNAIRQPQADSGKHEAHDHGGGLDPHAWQDLANARRYVANITAALGGCGPGREDASITPPTPPDWTRRSLRSTAKSAAPSARCRPRSARW